MKVLAIRNLVENYTLPQLHEAEAAIIQEKPVRIDVEGTNEAERLTHLIAATWILEEMRTRRVEFPDALCEYSKRVRDN